VVLNIFCKKRKSIFIHKINFKNKIVIYHLQHKELMKYYANKNGEWKLIIVPFSKRSNCTDGYLKIYLKGQETADAYDKFDYELCGNETQRVISEGPRLAMVLVNYQGEYETQPNHLIIREVCSLHEFM